MADEKEPVEQLFEPKKSSREFTLNADTETYQIITKVAKEVGRSRPKVLSMFVLQAYKVYLEKQKERNEGELFQPSPEIKQKVAKALAEPVIRVKRPK